MKRYFESREEVVKLLESKGFKYYVPRKREYMNAWSDKNKSYYVEISENDKILYCSVVAIKNNNICAEHPFYDCNRAYNFYTKEEGELNYKERLELEEFLY